MTTALIAIFAMTQVAYLVSFACELYLQTRPVDWVRMEELSTLRAEDYPQIVLLYPVLRELEQTMRSTMSALANVDYPRDRYSVVAIPNSSDVETVRILRELQRDFPFLELLEVPPTSDPSWSVVWDAWDSNEKAYWWHRGRRARDRDLPPKKTRQLVYAFYTLAERRRGGEDWLLDYIDADSVPAPDHFVAGAVGMRRYDVLQATNIAGNLLDTWPASWHAMDHMAWDGYRYPHLSAHGSHPFWVLGKGLFFQASDLVELGSFNPWITIEDPEVGMRLWANGRRLGIIATPLIEEVPRTIRHGITQRKRWACGFFQSLIGPTKAIGMTPWQRARAWVNFIPCLFLFVNPIGIPVGIWALVDTIDGGSSVPPVFIGLALVNLAFFLVGLVLVYRATWARTRLVLDTRRDRLRFMFRVNPLFLVFFRLVWVIPLVLGLEMYLRDKGKVWERTEKVDANHDLVAALNQRARAIAPAGSAETQSRVEPVAAAPELEGAERMQRRAHG